MLIERMLEIPKCGGGWWRLYARRDASANTSSGRWALGVPRLKEEDIVRKE